MINHEIKRHNGNIWTVSDEKHVVTRFFVVYPPVRVDSFTATCTMTDRARLVVKGVSAQKAFTAQTESASFLQQVHNALAVDSVSMLSKSMEARKRTKK